MTTTAEPTTLEIGKARTRKEDARLITGRTRYTDSITPAGTLHIVRRPLAAGARDDHRHRQVRGRGGPRRHRRLHRRRPRRRGRRPAVRVADHPGHEGPAAPAARHQHRALRRRGRRRRRGPHAPPRPRDAADLVEVDYDPLEPVLDMEAALAGGRHPGAPGPGHQRERDLGVRLRRGRHRRQRRRGHRRRRGRPGLGRRQAPVPPAAPDPGVHGAALLRGRPDR